MSGTEATLSLRAKRSTRAKRTDEVICYRFKESQCQDLLRQFASLRFAAVRAKPPNDNYQKNPIVIDWLFIINVSLRNSFENLLRGNFRNQCVDNLLRLRRGFVKAASRFC